MGCSFCSTWILFSVRYESNFKTLEERNASDIVKIAVCIENKWPRFRIGLTFFRLNYNTVCAILYIGLFNLSSSSQSSIFYFFLSQLFFIIVSSSHFFFLSTFYYLFFFVLRDASHQLHRNDTSHNCPKKLLPQTPHPDIKSRVFVGSFLFVGKHPRMQGREVREIGRQHPKQHKKMPRSGSMNLFPLAQDLSSNTNYIHLD